MIHVAALLRRPSGRLLSRLAMALAVVVPLIVLLANGSRLQAQLREHHRGASQSEWYSKRPKDPIMRLHPNRTTPIGEALQALFRPMLIHPAAPIFHAQDGNVYTIPHPDRPVITEPLGKRICIVDIDGRGWEGENQVFSPLPLNTKTIRDGSLGIMNHFLYAQIHGYQYHYIQTQPNPPDGRSQVWEELVALLELLETGTCEYLFSLDTDTAFTHLELPVEWMLNRWNFEERYIITMALDPDTPISGPVKDWTHVNRDDTGRVWGNPGVQVIRNSADALDMMRDWYSCPMNENKYPGCHRWVHDWPAEMTAFSNWIRYDERWRDRILETPCADSNGFPEMRTECLGLFVRHYTTDKTLLIRGATDAIFRAVLDVIHEDLVENRREVIKHQGGLSVVGSGPYAKPTRRAEGGGEVGPGGGVA